MIDLNTEAPIRINEAARIAGQGRAGKPIHPATVLRWILDGVLGPGGQRIRLEAARLGAHWVTSREALHRFAQALTPDLDAEQAPPPRAPGRRQRESQRAARQLEKVAKI